MDASGLFAPPPQYLDNDDYTFTHGLAPQSYTTLLATPLDPRAVSHKANVDQRRRHVRRLYDLLQLTILRNDKQRAARCLYLLLRMREWRPVELWKFGLKVAAMPDALESHRPLAYLQQISRTRTELRPYVLPFLVRELVFVQRYEDALEEITSVISVYPYRHIPQLHTYLGLLTLYIGASRHPADAQLTASPSLLVPSLLSLHVAPQVRRMALHHFENAIKVAPRYTALQTHVFSQRVRSNARRTARLEKLAKDYRARCWASLRDSGWVFRDGDTTASATETMQQHSPEPSASYTDDMVRQLPDASYFSMDSDIEGDFEPETGPNYPDAIVLGAELPPDLNRPHTPTSDAEDEPLSPELLPAMTDTAPRLLLPACTWAVHVATMYLRMIQGRPSPASIAGGVSKFAGDELTLTATVGVAEDRNSRWRRSMEDAHAFDLEFNGVQGQNFFAIFDGHAGKFAAEWSSKHLAQILAGELDTHPSMDVREVLKNTFEKADAKLETASEVAGMHSGCTAVASLLRYEECGEAGSSRRRVLYSANVGDARTVLCRAGKAVRLTYDHKGSDAQEVKRITDKGGFLLNNRVNGTILRLLISGVLAVTRSLGDFSMKEFVVGAPFTTSIELNEDDAFVIMACDGVCTVGNCSPQLWDVVDDQTAVDLIADTHDPQAAAEQLLNHALDNFSTDNTTVMVIRIRPQTV
ncbi:protein-serine/threonine phosphatase [Malassezia vespertilionis]|uniref:protein-serine/threonine phosphatase n=1 Tax=Malassezia vespertilionis TaxID=2020962 RepID=UPI0024B23232|nr:protein-serine/threonine phosphatase [Malassezia vespertilionis]WFD07253.1 protein-serine/threonine phosphatase [Malassezia vespertilionis]